MSGKSAEEKIEINGTARSSSSSESSNDLTEGADIISESENENNDDNESLDPRIQDELEKLNSSTDVINKLEVDLEEARHTFRILMRESSLQLERLAKQIGATCVDKSRPYYEARMKARKAHAEAQNAAARFEKASNAHEAAKEMVNLAEEGYKERGSLGFDQAWQEMLNHASTRVNESEAERNASASEHRAKSAAYSLAERKVQQLQKSLKRSINKSRPYFEQKAHFNQLLDDQKRQVQLIEETIVMTKSGYSDSLKELERISEEIHQRRQKRCQTGNAIRGRGVGSEFPDPPRSAERRRHHKNTGNHFDDDVVDASKLSITDDGRMDLGTIKAGRKLSLPFPQASSTPKGNGRANAVETSSEKSSPTNASPSSCEQLRDVPKINLLSVRRLSDDEYSDAGSMASMEPLDDDQIEMLMLDSDEVVDIMGPGQNHQRDSTAPLPDKGSPI